MANHGSRRGIHVGLGEVAMIHAKTRGIETQNQLDSSGGFCLFNELTKMHICTDFGLSYEVV